MSSDSTYASAPFDHDKADIILRSSNNIDFRIFKLFLSLASPFFETLFDIPQPAEAGDDQEIKDGLVVVPVTENSKILDALLRFCYPCTLADDPNIETLKGAMDILEAARKYSLDAIEKKALRMFSDPKILEVEPLRCFAIAHRGRLREETFLAAKYTLALPLIPSWFEEIELISAGDLLSLSTYHKRCGDAVYALRLDLSWITSHYGSAQSCSWLQGQWQCKYEYPRDGMFSHTHTSAETRYGNCSCPRVAAAAKFSLFSKQSLQWWENFMVETFETLRDKPCKATLQACAEKTVETVKTRNCQACSPKVTEGMREFVDLFGRKIEETVAQNYLHLGF